jgi:hypothetical protein
MSTPVVLLLVLGAAGGLALAPGVLHGPCANVTESVAFSYPTGASDADHEAFHAARLRGEALPAGFTVTAFEGRVEVRAADDGGGQEVVVTDDLPDLVSAVLTLGGEEIAAASRAAGEVVERDGRAVAVLRAAGKRWFPRQGEVVWTGADGARRSATVCLH